MDPRNVPFGTDRREGAEALPRQSHTDVTLKLESVLLAEYEYASVTAYQAQEDRARVFNLYLLLIGILTSALTALYQLGDRIKQYTPQLAFLTLVLSGVLGIIFFLKLIRLRQAFRDSLIAMNRIKEYYINRLLAEAPDLEDAFHWRLRSLPRGERVGSLTFLVCFTVALLESLCFAGASVVGLTYAQASGWLSSGTTLNSSQIDLISICVMVGILCIHEIYYRRQLGSKVETRQIESEEHKLKANDS